MGRWPELLVGLDIGSGVVAAVVAEPGAGDALSVVGMGAAMGDGLRNGVVVNMEATVQTIASAVKEAELSAGCEIHSVFAGVGGPHVKGFNSHGSATIRAREVGPLDVDHVLEAARAVALPLDRDILHMLPQEFVVDGKGGIKEPVGMLGVRLEARVHIVSTMIAAAQSAIKCCHRSGLNVAELVLAQLGAAEAVLTAGEKKHGITVVDLGAATTGLLAYEDGAVKHTAVLPVGGNHISSDISAGLCIPFREAEQLKRRCGASVAAAVPGEEMVEVPAVGGRAAREIPRRLLAEIIEPRLAEIFALARQELVRCGLEGALAPGVVLTGGTALIDGAAALAERVFQAPARIGTPVGCDGSDEALAGPAYAAAVGLTRYATRPREHLSGLVEEGHVFARVGRRMAGWLKELV